MTHYNTHINTGSYSAYVLVTDIALEGNTHSGHNVKIGLRVRDDKMHIIPHKDVVRNFIIPACTEYKVRTFDSSVTLYGYIGDNCLHMLSLALDGKLDYYDLRNNSTEPTSAPDIDTDPNDKNSGIMLDMIRKINAGVTQVQLVKEFPVISNVVCMIYTAYNKVLLAKQNLSINKDTNAYQPHMVSDTMLVQHTIVSIYEDEMLPGIKKLIENGATVPTISTSAKISIYEATWMIWFAEQYMIIVGKYGFSLRLSDYRYSDDKAKRQAILDIHKIASAIHASIGFAYSIAKTSGLDVDLIKMVANVCIANNLHHSVAANTPELFTVIVRIIYHDVMSVNLKDLIRRGKSVAEITAEIPDAYNCRYLEWMIWFVKQYDEEIEKALEPKDEHSFFVKSAIKRLNALQ